MSTLALKILLTILAVVILGLFVLGLLWGSEKDKDDFDGMA